MRGDFLWPTDAFFKQTFFSEIFAMPNCTSSMPHCTHPFWDMVLRALFRRFAVRVYNVCLGNHHDFFVLAVIVHNQHDASKK